VKLVKIATIILSILIAVAFIIGSAMAVPPGKTIELPDGAMGKVTFSGDTHSMKQGLKCSDCHPKPFAMKKGEFKETKEDHGKDVYCGICHNGTKAFSMTDAKDCSKCHKKSEEAPAAPAAPAEEQKEMPKETPKEEMK
jgi:c(7)-type cytochrome triheme protein